MPGTEIQERDGDAAQRCRRPEARADGIADEHDAQQRDEHDLQAQDRCGHGDIAGGQCEQRENLSCKEKRAGDDGLPPQREPRNRSAEEPERDGQQRLRVIDDARRAPHVGAEIGRALQQQCRNDIDDGAEEGEEYVHAETNNEKRIRKRAYCAAAMWDMSLGIIWALRNWKIGGLED